MTRGKPDQFHSSQVKFIGEQDGIPEQVLKKTIGDYLIDRNANCRAYLARVRYPAEVDWSVAVCVCGRVNIEKIDAAVGVIFSEMFKTDEHLDIVQISEHQEVELKQVARPFYAYEGKSNGSGLFDVHVK